MSQSSLHVLLLSALVAQGQCMMFQTMPNQSGSQAGSAYGETNASSNLTGSASAPLEANDQKYSAFLEASAKQPPHLPPVGTAICQHLEVDEKDNTQVPYKFRTVERLGQFICEEDEPLFVEPHSLFDWRCAHRCLATPECKFMQVFFILKPSGDWKSTRCEGYSNCSKLVEYPDYTEGVNISIYERNPELAGQRRQVPFLDSFRVRARQRLLLYINFNEPVESPNDDAVRRIGRGKTQGGDDDDTMLRLSAPRRQAAADDDDKDDDGGDDDDDDNDKEVCDLSEAACRAAAESSGLLLGFLGFAFAGDYSETGCYAYSGGTYAGRAFYGYADGGGEVSSESQLTTISSEDKYRIDLCAAATPAASVAVLQGTDSTTDIFFQSEHPNAGYDEKGLEVDTRDNNGHKWALVKFAIPPTTSNVVSAHLEVEIYDAGDRSLLHEMLADWDSSSTFSSVGMSGTGVGNRGVWNRTVVSEMTGDEGTASLDVTSSVKRWQSGESTNYGWIWEPTGPNGVDFYSSTGTVPPKLTIVYEDVSEATTTASPGGTSSSSETTSSVEAATTASPGGASSSSETASSVEAYVQIATNRRCTGQSQLMRFEGPIGKSLDECFVECLQTPTCSYFGSWPAEDQRGPEGSRDCRLYKAPCEPLETLSVGYHNMLYAMQVSSTAETTTASPGGTSASSETTSSVEAGSPSGADGNSVGTPAPTITPASNGPLINGPLVPTPLPTSDFAEASKSAVSIPATSDADAAAEPSPAPTPAPTVDPIQALASHRRRVSRRRTVVKDGSGREKGSLWTGESVENVEHAIPQFSDTGKFGGFWSFKNQTTGIRVPQNEELQDYSIGPGATIVVVYRKDGYDSHMGRIFSGPNVDLYGWTNGMAINMNDVRCLYTDHTIYDNDFHFIFVIIRFATGLVEVWRDNVHIGNGTHGKLTDDFDSLQTTFPWMIGKRYDYDTERNFDGDADEFAIFSYPFTDQDRDKYIDCGGLCFDNCTDKDELIRIRFATETLITDFVDRCNETCMTCVADTVRSVVSNYTNVSVEYISFAYGSNISLATNSTFGSFFLTYDLDAVDNGNYTNYTLFLELNVSVPPCTLEEVLARLNPITNLVYDVEQEMDCVTAIGFDPTPEPPNITFPPTPTPWLPGHYHPRVLITPWDLPTIRSRLAESWVAQEAKNTLLDRVELFDPSSQYGQLYNQLKECNVTYLASLTTVEELLVNQRNNTEWIAFPDIYTMFMISGLVALLDEDNATGEELGAALTCHSEFMLDVFQPEMTNVLNEDCEPALGLAYDYLYNFMTPEQHAPVRLLISRYTTGRVPYGSTLRDWQLGANGVGFFDGVVVQSLAIEYEEGWDSMVFLNDVRTQKKYWKWTVFDSGFTHEGWHYFMFSMEGAGPAMLAAEIRGQGVLAETNAVKAMTGAFYQMSPWITGEQVKIFSYSDGTGIGSPGRINIFFPIMKRLYPNDPVIDFVYSLQIEHQEDRKLTSDWMLFGLIPNRTDWTTKEVADAAGFSLSRFCPDSGRVIMRSDWTEDGMAVHFWARMDTYGVQKMHADINTMALFSHRRQWVMDTDLAGTLKYQDEFNDMHSTILIDGLGQSGTSTMKTWPSLPGKILDFQDLGPVAFAVGDATLAYTYYSADYQCGKTSKEYCNEDVGWGCMWDPDVWGCVRNWSSGEFSPFNISTRFTWGQNNDMQANMRTFSYPRFFNGSSRDLDAESEKWREQHPICPITMHGGRCWGGHYNPVNFAYRTVVLMRGTGQKPHPYVLVLDDIEAQDKQAHNYTISWQVRPHQDHWSRTYADVDIKRWELNREMHLKSKLPGEARLVHVLTGGQGVPEDFPELVVRMVGNPAEGPVDDDLKIVNEDKRHGQSGLKSSGYQRLIANRMTTLPKFKTIFYPREQDDPELVTAYDARADTLTVTINETVDEFKFVRSIDGRTMISTLSRNGEAVIAGRR